MNAAIRLYADAANAKTKQDNGFDLTDYDERTLKFAREYSEHILAVDINIDTEKMLDTTWNLFSENFAREEVVVREEFVEKYWKGSKQ